MPVPVATMDQNDFPEPREYKIRRAREIAPMQPEPVAECMSSAPDA
jgi:hypothetical protein